MLNDFLFELGCEELPSASVFLLANELAQLMKNALAKAQIACEHIQPFATPRRIAILMTQVASEQPQQRMTKRGPALAAAYDAEGNPTPALTGFAKSCGVDIDKLKHSKTEKGEWLVYELETQGAQTSAILPALIQQALAALPIAKPMRWGNEDYEFARPIHWALMLWGEKVLDAEVFGVKTSNLSYGHRFHHPQAVNIKNPRDYEQALSAAFVHVDFHKRRELIIQQIQQLAKDQQAVAVMPEELIDEVCSIVEWPQPLLVNFDPAFLEVPSEALIAAMQSHQKCFALKNKAGALLPHFITISNIQSSNPAQVIAGNEKVMRARLSDAAFFFNQDKKHSLSRHLEATGKVVFQAKLGTLLDKSIRMQGIMEYLIQPFNLDRQEAMRAAELSKCDLMTGMVGEFPELQGLMGYYYALHDKEKPAVALAVQEQYLPRFAADELPKSKLGLALSLADRIDTLVGIFAIGQRPTGVKDPFKLRRHALAVVRMLISQPVVINLTELINTAVDLYGTVGNTKESALNELKPFIMERLHSHYQGQAVRADLILAVRARQSDWLYDFEQRIKALCSFIALPEAAVLSAACKRVDNILQQNKLNGAERIIDTALFTETAEQELYARLVETEALVQASSGRSDYHQILNHLAALRDPVDAFFDRVLVMVEDEKVRGNRLALLTRLQALLQGVADISLLQNPA